MVITIAVFIPITIQVAIAICRGHGLSMLTIAAMVVMGMMVVMVAMVLIAVVCRSNMGPASVDGSI